MTICSFVGDGYLKNIFHLSAKEAVKHPDYDKYIGVLSKAIKDFQSDKDQSRLHAAWEQYYKEVLETIMKERA